MNRFEEGYLLANGQRHRPQTNTVEISEKSKRSFDAMQPDFKQLEAFENKVHRKVGREEASENKVETEAVLNVMGSTAGAGSGDFHTYRGFRNKEMAREKDMLEEAKREKVQAEWEAELAEREAALQAKSSKRAAKRQKEKEKQKAKRTQGGDVVAGSAAAGSAEAEAAPAATGE